MNGFWLLRHISHFLASHAMALTGRPFKNYGLAYSFLHIDNQLFMGINAPIYTNSCNKHFSNSL